MKKTLNLLFLLLAVFAISSCSSDDDEKKDSVKEITIYVSSETGESYGFNSTPEECMLVKFDNPMVNGNILVYIVSRDSLM